MMSLNNRKTHVERLLKQGGHMLKKSLQRDLTEQEIEAKNVNGRDLTEQEKEAKKVLLSRLLTEDVSPVQ